MTKELTKEQEDLIHDLPHHDKKVEGSIRGAKVVGKIPINHDVFNQILVGIGRRKFGKVTTEVKGGNNNGT